MSVVPLGMHNALTKEFATALAKLDEDLRITDELRQLYGCYSKRELLTFAGMLYAHIEDEMGGTVVYWDGNSWQEDPGDSPWEMLRSWRERWLRLVPSTEFRAVMAVTKFSYLNNEVSAYIGDTRWVYKPQDGLWHAA